MEQVWYTASAWIGLALLASIISIRIGISVALVEIFLGFLAGNLGTALGVTLFQPTAWINFLAGFASVVLTFLAGTEIEMVQKTDYPWDGKVVERCCELADNHIVHYRYGERYCIN